MKTFMGIPYPIKKSPLGFLWTQSGIDQIKSDMLILLLTNPGERVMNPYFGTPLKTLIFEQNDSILQVQAKNMIINSIKSWEPRIVVQDIEVNSQSDINSLNKLDDLSEYEHILFIRIIFVDPQSIQTIQQLTLEVPLGGS
jgi:uncharacterized protein